MNPRKKYMSQDCISGNAEQLAYKVNNIRETSENTENNIIHG